MDYIIDGHNLISKIAGLNLSMPDDEQRLVELLIRFEQDKPHRLEVYFDGAPVGQAGLRNYGRVRAHFVSRSQTADDAIRTELSRLGHSARNWAVVTSDRAVQAAAHAAHARVVTAEEFARTLKASMLQASLQNGVSTDGSTLDLPISETEVNEWLDIFKKHDGQK